MKHSKREIPPTSLRFPPELKKVLQEEAARRDRPFSYLVFDILRQWCGLVGASKRANLFQKTEEERN